MMREPELRFAFGANWQSFVNTVVDEQRITTAVDSLQLQHADGYEYELLPSKS